MKNTTGHFLQQGKAAFFPEQPYMIEGSVKENIIFYEEFDSVKYYKVFSLVGLNNDTVCSYPGYDDIPVSYLDLSMQQLQKISMARAIFCER